MQSMNEEKIILFTDISETTWTSNTEQKKMEAILTEIEDLKFLKKC